MNRRTQRKGFLSLGVLLGGAALCVVFLAFLVAFLWVFRSGSPANASVEAAVTVIPAPTLTPKVLLPGMDSTSTPTPLASGPGSGPIHVGVYVQITGTNGDGLRIRSAPGVSSTPLFLGMDSEVFLVKDGPRQADGYTWWLLTAPYDTNRSGWAAASYLSLVQTPQS